MEVQHLNTYKHRLQYWWNLIRLNFHSAFWARHENKVIHIEVKKKNKINSYSSKKISGDRFSEETAVTSNLRVHLKMAMDHHLRTQTEMFTGTTLVWNISFDSWAF